MDFDIESDYKISGRQMLNIFGSLRMLENIVVTEANGKFIEEIYEQFDKIIKEGKLK